MNSSWRAAILAFLLGCVLGGLAGAYAQRRAFQRFWRHGPDTARVLGRLERRLDLDEGQKAAVRTVLEKEHAEMAELQKRTAARFSAMRADLRARVSAVLRPDQRARFARMTARWDARHKLLDPGPGRRP